MDFIWVPIWESGRCRWYPLPPVVYWHHGFRGKLQSNLWRTMTYAQNPDFKELASRVEAVNRTASALAIICLVPGRRKGRCHNRTVEIPVRTELLQATALRRCIQLARFSARPSGISITFPAGKSSEGRNVSLRDDTNEPRSFLNYSLADSRQTTHRRCWLERIAGDRVHR